LVLETAIKNQCKEILEYFIYSPLLIFNQTHALVKLPESRKSPLQYALDVKSSKDIIHLLLQSGAGICAKIVGRLPEDLDTTDLILIGFSGIKSLSNKQRETAILTIEKLKRRLSSNPDLKTESLLQNCLQMSYWCRDKKHLIDIIEVLNPHEYASLPRGMKPAHSCCLI
jgi:hypothetical protein